MGLESLFASGATWVSVTVYESVWTWVSGTMYALGWELVCESGWL